MPTGKVDPIILLLSGVVKFNTTLKSLFLSGNMLSVEADAKIQHERAVKF